ncbi:MAG: ankyrin repeat domain-containing protein [Acidimicrobiales bacterium]
MTTHSLPARPDLERLKRSAKTLRDDVRRGSPVAIERVREHHPRLGELTAGSRAATGFKLADAQLTVARRYGFPSWPRLTGFVDVVNRLSRSPHEQPVGQPLADDAARADELLRLACLNYGADDAARPAQARLLLSAHPHLARWSIHTMAAVGDAAAAGVLLDADPRQADRLGGPFGWEPLLYAAYSRLDDGDPAHDTLEVARLLLANGADPNAGFLWDGLVPPFTALTGAFGRGEGAQPPHPRSLELARLLLEAGADPNDSQTVYNCGPGDMATDDTEFLGLLIEFGFGRGDGGPWFRRLAPEYPTPSELMAEALQHAAQAGLVRRTRLLLANGADPDGRGGHPLYGGRTAYQAAVLHGNVEVAGLLVDAGAAPSGVDPLSRFVGVCMAGDQAAVDAALADDPSLLERALLLRPDLVARASELGRPDAVRLMVDLGFDVNARHRTTALHEAAWRGDVGLARVLVELGADPSATDTEHDSTPRGWAEYGGQAEMAAYLAGLESG